METPEPAERNRSRLKLWLAGSGAAILLVLAGAGGWLYSEIHRPYAGFEEEVFVQIPFGDSSREIGAVLARRGVVSKEWLFLAVRALRPKAVLQAGEYRFARPASVWKVFDRITRGDVFYYTITIPEGNNRFDTARFVAELDWVEEDSVLEITANPDLISDLDPAAETLEGYLFPSTYRVTRGTSAMEICRMMTAEFRRVWGAVGGDADVRKTVVLASLVEKETGVGDERPLVASVFHNRLRRGMKMECDPTVIYAAILEDRYDGIIHRSDLDSKNPYNTYQHTGLPPGPIASPGRAAIVATLNPADTDYIFFVAAPDGSGRHVFSETLAAHNRAVARYRRGIRETRRQSPARRTPQAGSSGETD